jgi:hypothetical protein
VQSFELPTFRGAALVNFCAANKMKAMKHATTILTVALLGVLSSAAHAQWPRFSPAGVPKTADGKVNMAAPAPRTADGKPDLSGVWETIPGRRPSTPAVAAEGTGELPPSGSVFGNIGDQIQGGAPYQPWAAELVKERMADNSKDNPDAHCLPMGDADDVASVSEKDPPDSHASHHHLRRLRDDYARSVPGRARTASER